MSLSPVIYIPHGGGPLPLLGDPGHHGLAAFLQSVPGLWTRPDAILVISAHWEEISPGVTSGARPELFYDYYGFPDEAYAVSYPAPGSPSLAGDIADLLLSAGFNPVPDDNRGFDHGMFVPLKLMYPDALIPCVQLSLMTGLDPAGHIRLGKALSPLRARNILTVGSGMSYHNLSGFFTPIPGTEERNADFHRWLRDTCVNSNLTAGEREERLAQWEAAPHARFCHPREEHLIPLHVCFGMAASGTPAAREVFSGDVMGREVTSLLWH